MRETICWFSRQQRENLFYKLKELYRIQIRVLRCEILTEVIFQIETQTITFEVWVGRRESQNWTVPTLTSLFRRRNRRDWTDLSFQTMARLRVNQLKRLSWSNTDSKWEKSHQCFALMRALKCWEIALWPRKITKFCPMVNNFPDFVQVQDLCKPQILAKKVQDCSRQTKDKIRFSRCWQIENVKIWWQDMTPSTILPIR